MVVYNYFKYMQDRTEKEKRRKTYSTSELSTEDREFAISSDRNVVEDKGSDS